MICYPFQIKQKDIKDQEVNLHVRESNEGYPPTLLVGYVIIYIINQRWLCVCVHVCLCPESVSIKSELKLNHFSALLLYQTTSGVTKKKQALLLMKRFFSKARLIDNFEARLETLKHDETL